MSSLIVNTNLSALNAYNDLSAGLQQTGTAMLSQAQQAPNLVLKLI